MGGRGSNSGFVVPPVPPVPPLEPPQPPQPIPPGKFAETSKDFQELQDRMQKEYGLRIRSGLAQQDFETVRNSVAGIETLLTEFPKLQGVLKQIGNHESKRNVYAHASAAGDIQLNAKKYSDRQKLLASYAKDVRSGFHPRGTDADSIAVHEAGHILELALGKKAGTWFKWGPQATQVIHEACQNLKQTPYGAGKHNNDFVRSVSHYALHDRSEALAECVADYHANGSNSKPLSQEVWRILKRELG